MLSLLPLRVPALAQLRQPRVHLVPLAIALVDLAVVVARNTLVTLVAHLAIVMFELSKLLRNLPCWTMTCLSNLLKT